MAEAIKKALETVHQALNNNNEGLDPAIAALKETLVGAGQKTVEMDKTRLPQNNRQGRKMLQTYFKKRGVVVTFAE